MLAINRIGLLVLGFATLLIATAGAVRGRPGLPLLALSLIAAVAIAYSVLQRLRPWLLRLLGIIANGAFLLGTLQGLFQDWRSNGPSLMTPFGTAAVLLLFGVPLVQLCLGTTPPAVWKKRA